MMWGGTMPMWRDEWCRHCDVAWSYQKPCDDTSGGGSSVLGDPGPLSHDEGMSGAENVGES